MAIFTRAQSNPMFPQNLPNPNPRYFDLGQSLDSIFNNYLRSKQLGLQEKQFNLQQTRADLENQQIQNQMAQQQLGERVRYGGTITGPNPTYSPEQIQSALGPAPAPVQASVPYNLVNPNLYQQRPEDAINPPQNAQVAIPQIDPLPQLRAGLANDRSMNTIAAQSPLIKQQLDLATINEKNANAEYLRNFNSAGGVPQLKNIGGQQVIISPAKGGPRITPIGNQPGFQMDDSGRMVPIPGSEQERKYNEEIAARNSKFQQGLATIDNTLKNLDYLRSNANYLTTGIGSYTGAIPSTPARALNNTLEAVKSAMKIEALMSLKNSSANGASGFGSLSEKEGEALAGQIATLDPKDPKFVQNVNQIYDFLKTRRDQDYSNQQIKLGNKNTDNVETRYINGQPVRVRRLPNGDYEEVQ